MEALYEHNIWNGLSIFKKQEGYIELWGFASDRKTDSMSRYYFNNIHLLKSFVTDFSIISSKLFLTEGKENLAIYQDYQVPGEILEINYKNNSKEIDNFLQSTKPRKRICIMTKRGEEYLTKPEAFCMQKLIKGLSAKEIARLVSRSHRTIEKHIDNIKNKLECHDTHDLKNIYKLGRISLLDHENY